MGSETRQVNYAACDGIGAGGAGGVSKNAPMTEITSVVAMMVKARL